MLGSHRSPSFALDGIDYTALARGYGCPARRVVRGEELRAALDEALHAGGPFLLDVAVDAAARKLY